MIATVIGQANGLVVGLKHRLKRVLRLGAVLVHLDGPIVDLGHGDYLDVIAEACVLAFAVDVTVDVFRDVLLKVVGVFGLNKKKIYIYI